LYKFKQILQLFYSPLLFIRNVSKKKAFGLKHNFIKQLKNMTLAKVSAERGGNEIITFGCQPGVLIQQQIYPFQKPAHFSKRFSFSFNCDNNNTARTGGFLLFHTAAAH